MKVQHEMKVNGRGWKSKSSARTELIIDDMMIY